MDPGIYEVLVTEALRPQLDPLGRLARKRSLHTAEAPDRIALHLSREIERSLAAVSDSDRVQVGIQVARDLIARLAALVDTDTSETPAEPRDRRVSPRERSRWRFTFKRLAAEAQDALRSEDAGPAASALEQLIDLACEAHGYDYFRSDDPVATAGFVVCDVAAVLWASVWERHGFKAFAETAAPQLIRWESRYGWTRYGEGSVAAKETSLAVVLARMLRVPDTWEGFAEQYAQALDRLCDGRAPTRPGGRFVDAEQERASALARWHGLLLENLADTDGDLLDRIVTHAGLGGPEQTFHSARLAHQRGNTDVARELVMRCLRKLPGHSEFREFAAEIGAVLG